MLSFLLCLLDCWRARGVLLFAGRFEMSFLDLLAWLLGWIAYLRVLVLLCLVCLVVLSGFFASSETLRLPHGDMGRQRKEGPNNSGPFVTAFE